jgi:predicted small secreted protein
LSMFLWSLYCLSFDLRFLVTLVFVLVAIVLSVFWSTVSGYSCLCPCGHCIVCPLIYGFWLLLSLFLWSLYCLSFDLRFLVTLVFLLVAIVLSVCWSTVSGYSCLCSCGHCIVCPLIYGFWLLLSLFLWSLYCLSFDLRFLVILVFVLVAIVLSVLWSTVSGYPFGIFKVFLIEFGHLFKPIWCTWSQSLLNYLAFQSFEYLSVHDEGYCRNVTWELN